jgi:hypothetical protein
MATRMQQRRGTAAQWISTNSGNGPILNAGEIGYETDTNKFKIGDGTNHWINLDYFVDANSTVNPAFGTSIVFEGATADSYETTLQVTDPTADRTITLPNVDGTVITTGNLSDITNIGVFTSTITMEGSTANDFELTLSAGDPTADRTITFPDATGTVVLRDSTDTLTNKSISLGSNTVTSTLAQLNTAVTDADVASLAGTETLTNKTLTSPTVSGLIISDSGIVFEGATANDYETTLTVTDPTADRILTLPNSTGTIATEEYVDSAVSGAEVDQSTLAGTGISWNPGTSKFDVDTLTIQARVADVSDTEIGYLNGVTSAIQTQIDNKASLSGATFTGAVSGTSLTLSGDLTVNGTTTNINSTNLVVEDKNVVLGDTATPTDTTADGGGITLKGATDKTLNWVDATDAWTSSEDFNLLTGKVYEINGTSVLSGSTLGSGVTASSLTSVGTITSGTWTGTAIAIANGGTGQTTAMTAATALLPAQTSNSGKYLTTDGSGTLSWGTVSQYSAPTIGSTSIASGATVTTIAGLTLSSPSITGSLTAGGGTGTSGQVLSSTGSGVQWSTPAAGAAFSELMLIGA